MLCGTRDAKRRVAQRSAAQHSTCKQHMHDCDTAHAHTHMCRARRRAVLSQVTPTHRTSFVSTAWRFFLVPDRAWGFVVACAGLFPCAVAAGLSWRCGTCSRLRLPWQRPAAFS